MFKKISSLLCVFIVSVAVVCVGQDSPAKPLLASQIFTLVAGNALPQNIVHEINNRGLNFHPTAEFQVQLRKAGADDSILAAINKTEVINTSEDLLDKELLQHLTVAAGLMADKHYPEVAKELSVALQSSFASTETGFVMGELLRRQEEWEKAALVYEHVLEQDPNFPEAHTKLSYVLGRMENFDESLNEAKEAIAINPENAEAHKNAALALDGEHKPEAAIAEYKEALRIKPDYDAVHYDLGLLFYNTNDYENSIAEYKKAIALNPNNADYHTNLGTTYYDKDDIDSAISEQREAKRLNPNEPLIRQNLAAALMQRNPHEADEELKDLEKNFPNFEACHECLGKGLLWEGDRAGAKEEFMQEAKLDPSDPEPHISLGNIYVLEKNEEAALPEYRLAVKLGGGSNAYTPIASMLMEKKDFAGAGEVLKQAVMLAPSDASVHELYAHALDALGQLDLAIAEYKEAVVLDPKQSRAKIELATDLEKKGDWIGAMELYRRASLDEANLNSHPPSGQTFFMNTTQAEDAYKAAKNRFEDHLTSLKNIGQASEARDLEKNYQALDTAPNRTEKMELLVADADKAFSAKRFADAEKSYEEAEHLAEQPPADTEEQLDILKRLAGTYMMDRDFTTADAILHKKLAITEKIYGADSPKLVDCFIYLGSLSGVQKDFVSAENYFSKALALNEKLYGENSAKTADTLRVLAGVYEVQNIYDKAETYLLRAVKADEAAYGPDNQMVLIPLYGLCDMYDRADNPAKAQPCYDRAITIMEKASGENSPGLIPALKSDAQALRKLGHAEQAAKLEERSASIESASAGQN
jgi:tetratricopeptide (TPR) repeat protein